MEQTLTRVMVLPAVETADELLDLVARLSFYLSPKDDWIVTVPTSVEKAEALITPSSQGGAFQVPEGMDPRVTTLHRALAPRIELIDSGDEPRIRREHGAADIVFVRDRDGIRVEPWASIHALSANKRVYPVDRHRDRMEGSQYIQAVFANGQARDVLTEDSHLKFRQLADRIGHHQVAYLLATGPSIDRFSDFDFSDGLVIACNTTVLDEELLRHTRPRILTFADPIFHFGCSLYAAEFRGAVRSAAEDHDFDIVIPIKYYELYTSLEPSLAHRVVGLPFDQRDINLDLVSEFEVKVIDNIATFTMIPLGATFATDIGFLGFDGRKPEENYFWRHNPRTQLNHLMANIKSIHPGFFDVAYEDYYEQHCQNLARYIAHGEERGKRFYSLSPSAIPALAVRERTSSVSAGGLRQALGTSKPRFRVMMLNPDWVDDFGHYGSYDRRLSEAVDGLGGEVISVVNTALADSPPGLTAVRCFTDHSWRATRERTLGDVHLFEQELASLLKSYAAMDPETPTVFAMYVCSVWHLPSFVRLREKFADLPWVFSPNVFLLHEQLLKADLNPATDSPMETRVVSLTKQLRARLGIVLHADSVRLQRAIHRHAGEWPELWPMFSTTLDPESALAMDPVEDDRDRLQVYCPANAQLAKGYDLLAELATSVTEKDRRTWQLVTRAVVRPNTPRRLGRVAEQLKEHTEAMTGVLTDDEYLDVFRAADVVLIPYRFVPFASRTSAVLSDAVLLGKPVIATRGTWAGDWVDRLGSGVTFADGDVAGMLQAIRLVSNHIGHYREVANAVRTDWAEEHTPVRLAQLLASQATEARPVHVDEELRSEVREMTQAVAATLAQRGSHDSFAATDGAPPVRRAPTGGGALLSLLRLARRGERSRRLARRLYRASPSRVQKRVDGLVRSNPR